MPENRLKSSKTEQKTQNHLSFLTSLWKFQTVFEEIRQFMTAIDSYIHFYNERRIKVKLK
ncbi:MAG: IS3 family transposase [Clostridia bacterium]|nr:IS3 family transposase [Clostridia bacterium]MBR0445275.1 IS3 family transposase [Clostridia bacterium]